MTTNLELDDDFEKTLEQFYPCGDVSPWASHFVPKGLKYEKGSNSDDVKSDYGYADFDELRWENLNDWIIDKMEEAFEWGQKTPKKDIGGELRYYVHESEYLAARERDEKIYRNWICMYDKYYGRYTEMLNRKTRLYEPTRPDLEIRVSGPVADDFTKDLIQVDREKCSNYHIAALWDWGPALKDSNETKKEINMDSHEERLKKVESQLSDLIHQLLDHADTALFC